MRSSRGLFLAMCLFVATAPLRAEPVRFSLNNGEVAQGWMFTDHQGTCRIVTAAHVLRHGSSLVAPVAIDRRNRQIPTAQPFWPDKELDIAFLEANTLACPSDTLAETDVEVRLSASVTAFLQLVRFTEDRTLRLTREARANNESHGRIVLFSPYERTTAIAGGISGGAVTDGNGKLLAIVFGTDRMGRALAVRADVVSALLRELPSAQQSHSAVAGWTVSYGKLLDPLRGVDRILEKDGGWPVRPDQGFVTFAVRFQSLQQIGSISFRVDEASRGGVVNVEVSGAESVMQPVVSLPRMGWCQAAPGTVTLGCSFQPRSVRLLGVQIRLTTPEVTLSNFSVGPR